MFAGALLPEVPVSHSPSLHLGLLPKANAASDDALKQKKQQLDRRRAQVRQRKLEKLRKAREHESELVKHQRKLYSTYQQLQTQQSQMNALQSDIKNLTSELDKTYGELKRLEAATANRIRNIYMGGRLSWLERLFQTQDLNSFNDLLYYRKKVIAQDKQLQKDLNKKTEEIRKQKAQLDSRRNSLNQTIQGIESSKQTIAQQVRAEASLRRRYLNDAAYYERLERQLLAESANITRQLQSLKVGNVAKSTGSFMWPVSGRITSNFGYRYHPIHKRRILHTGLDIGAPTGRPIKAADGGNVYFAGWRGGYGKAVILTHSSRGGKTLVTLYGHMSSLSVSKGQSVSKGTVIGRVGSTGHSTGPHLHFEVRVNGAPVNPRNYL